MYKGKKMKKRNGKREEMITLNDTFFIHEYTRQGQNESGVQPQANKSLV